MLKNNKKLIGYMAILFYIITRIFVSVPFYILNIDLNQVSNFLKTLYLVGYDLITILILILIFFDEIQIHLKKLKSNHKKYFNEYLKYWFLALFLMSISNMLINTFTSQTASNQEAIDAIFKTNPLYMFFSAVVIAPLLEELVFRFSFRKIINNDYLFMFVSGISFGLIHILSSENILSELIFIIPYSIPGVIFAYTLVKSKNIFVPIGLHFIHNGILMSLQVLILLLG